jgi:hypothetical protein
MADTGCLFLFFVFSFFSAARSFVRSHLIVASIPLFSVCLLFSPSQVLVLVGQRGESVERSTKLSFIFFPMMPFLLLLFPAFVRSCDVCPGCGCVHDDLRYFAEDDEGVRVLEVPVTFPPDPEAWHFEIDPNQGPRNRSFFVDIRLGPRTGALSRCPVRIAAGDSQCEVQLNGAKTLVAPRRCYFKGARFDMTLMLNIRDQNQPVSNPMPTFNVHVFDTRAEFFKYAYCSPSKPAKSFEFRSSVCAVERFDTTDPFSLDSGLYVVTECFDPAGCNMLQSVSGRCYLDSSSGLGIAGSVICGLLFLVAVFLVVFIKCFLKRSLECEVVLLLVGIAVVSLLCCAFWVIFCAMGFFELVPFGPNFYLGRAMFWLDKSIILFATLLHLLLCYELLEVLFHGKSLALVRAIALGFAVVLVLACVGMTVPYYVFQTVGVTLDPEYNASLDGISRNYHMQNFWLFTDNSVDYADVTLQLFIAFTAVFFGTQVLLSLAFCLLGISLIVSHVRSGSTASRIVALKMVAMMLLLLLTSVGRMAIVFYCYNDYWSARLDGTTFSDTIVRRFYFSGVTNLNFSDNGKMPLLFYIIGYLLPDSVPFVVALYFIVSAQLNAFHQQKATEAGFIPLLEKDQIPHQYAI